MTIISIYFFVAVVAILGVGTAVWSYIDTRRKYYKDFMRRRPK